MDENHPIDTTAAIENRIFLVRRQKVMLSTDLAVLYEVAPKVLLQAVKRHADRFPADFMFQLSLQEIKDLKSQIVTSSWGGIRRALPYAFTEQGVAMLSGVLNSPRAIRVNIEIMRAFVRMKKMIETYRNLSRQLDAPDPFTLSYPEFPDSCPVYPFAYDVNVGDALVDGPLARQRWKIGFTRKDGGGA